MTVRQGISADTSERIADAAERLFLSRGYVGTTITAIAGEAGVVVQTIYNAVGGKAAVLNLVLDRTVSGPEAPRPVQQFMQERTRDLATAGEVVEVIADWFAEVHPRTADLFRLIREAAAVDPEVAVLENEREQRRLSNYELAAAVLVDKGSGTRLEAKEIAAVIWAMGHPGVFRRLVLDEGWSIDRYRAWLADTLRGALSAE